MQYAAPFRPLFALFIAASAVLIGSRSGNGAPAGPAPAASPAAAVVTADSLLKDFPTSANTAANDGRTMTIQGRVRDVRTITTADNKKELHLALSGSGRYLNTPAFILCRMDPASSADAALLQRDMIVSITGTFAGISTPLDQIDLNACHDIQIFPATRGVDDFLGGWFTYLSISGKDAYTFLNEHGRAEMLKTGYPSVLLYSHIGFDPDGALSLVINDPYGPVFTSKGTWTLISPPDKTLRLKLALPGDDPLETDLSLVGKSISFTMPLLQNLKFKAQLQCTRYYGVAITPNRDKLQADALRWMKANLILNPGDLVVDDMSAFMARTPDLFTLTFAGGLTRSHKTTVLVAGLDQVVPFEYSAAQMDASRVEPNSAEAADFQTTISNHWLEPEVKVDSITFDKKGPWDTAKPLNGKIRMRAMGQTVNAQYGLRLLHYRGFSNVSLQGIPGPEFQTFDFKVNNLNAHTTRPLASGTNPLPVMFVVIRSQLITDKTPTPVDQIVSRPQAMLVDMIPIPAEP